MILFYAPVAQRIEQWPPTPCAMVRFHSGAPRVTPDDKSLHIFWSDFSLEPSSQDICVDFQAQFLRRQGKNAQAYLCMASIFNAVMRKNLLERRTHTLVKTGS